MAGGGSRDSTSTNRMPTQKVAKGPEGRQPRAGRPLGHWTPAICRLSDQRLLCLEAAPGPAHKPGQQLPCTHQPRPMVLGPQAS